MVNRPAVVLTPNAAPLLDGGRGRTMRRGTKVGAAVAGGVAVGIAAAVTAANVLWARATARAAAGLRVGRPHSHGAARRRARA